MSDVLWLRNGSWPFQRLTLLTTVSAVSRPSGLMQGYRGSFSLAKNDPAISEMRCGQLVEMSSTDGLEPWIGWIDDPSYDSGAGVVTIPCVDAVTKLGERNTDIEGTRLGSAGVIARDLLFSVNSRNAFGVVWDTSSESGETVTEVDIGATSLLDALNKLVNLTNEEWWVRAEVAPDNLELHLHWARRRGYDLSQSVCLREGHEISVLSYTRIGPTDVGSVLVVGGSGTLVDRQIVARSGTGPERMSDPNVMVQPASETFKRAAPLPSALAAEQFVSLPRETDITALAKAAETRLEGEIDTSEEITFTANTNVDWSLLAVGNTVTVIFDDPILGTVQRTPRIREITPQAGLLVVKCFKQRWGLVEQLQQQDQALAELELV